mgnify:CR=1 FL=1
MKVDKNNNSVDWPLNKYNYILFGIGVLTICIGYILMATGEVDSFQSTKLSSVVLLIGYLFIIPLSIFYKK